MKSFPTALSPWFILVKNIQSSPEYYTTQGEGKDFSALKTDAFLFKSLTSAERTTKAMQKLQPLDNYDVIVLYDKEQVSEYGRDTYE